MRLNTPDSGVISSGMIVYSDMMLNVCVPLKGKGVWSPRTECCVLAREGIGEGYQGSCDIGALFYFVLVSFATLGTRFLSFLLAGNSNYAFGH